MYHSLTVVLERDMSPDYAADTIKAIRMIRGVLEVTPEVADIQTRMAESRAKQDLGQKILNVIFPK